MARRLRLNGTGSGEGGCPAVHEDLDSKEIIVHGTPLTDPEDIAQLRHLSDGEVPIVVPRELLVDFGPKEVSRVPRIIDLDAFGKLFENFQHTAWRLETRSRYASDEGTETYTQFLRGETPAWDLGTPWSVTIREKTQRGVTVGRVRIVDDPVTVGQRYLLAHADKNAALGEDIRNLWRKDAERLQLPAEDFWIFDSRIVAVLNFDEADNLVDVELITEPVEVNRYAQVRDAAWHYAVPYKTFEAGLTAAP
ncbi:MULTISPECIES: DUF6879 family protein [unclassified Streptomyces]|uniref:DUF6879 family protein n=1 Tax=unclassified Streptomyces TaxID=2593676 RepID=UPI000DC75AAE|nr:MULTISPECIES: DUF6879 family protein [unclassified Streptomyces]AWZ06849.1 hypothetical protein DRB89_22015 [Streptomyces sp. ICC4]AWZ14482.1 hypothetical protein DRB96_21925 [Streptomyces sp. ICC1]